eukprot:UN30897
MIGVVGSTWSFLRSSKELQNLSIEEVFEWHTTEGDSPVFEMLKSLSRHLSTTEHVKFRGNLRGPSRKAKYTTVTDSEQVP